MTLEPTVAVPRCQATLAGFQCELTANHSMSVDFVPGETCDRMSNVIVGAHFNSDLAATCTHFRGATLSEPRHTEHWAAYSTRTDPEERP